MHFQKSCQRTTQTSSRSCQEEEEKRHIKRDKKQLIKNVIRMEENLQVFFLNSASASLRILRCYYKYQLFINADQEADVSSSNKLLLIYYLASFPLLERVATAKNATFCHKPLNFSTTNRLYTVLFTDSSNPIHISQIYPRIPNFNHRIFLDITMDHP